MPVAASTAAHDQQRDPGRAAQGGAQSSVVAHDEHGHADGAEHDAGEQLANQDRGWADRAGQQPEQRAVGALVDQRGHAELHGEEQEEDRHPGGEVGLGVQDLRPGRGVDQPDGRGGDGPLCGRGLASAALAAGSAAGLPVRTAGA